MLSGAQAQAWASLCRSRIRVDLFSRSWSFPLIKNNFSAGFQLSQKMKKGYTGWKEIGQHRYPSGPVDLSVFENISGEYKNLVLRSAPAVPTSPNRTLVRLIGKGRYHIAERLRAEMVALGEEIHLNNIFEEAAAHVLRKVHLEPADRAAEFSDWFSLVPRRGPKKTRARTFSRIRLQLFKYNNATYLPVIMRFGIISASKGYTQAIALQVISFVVRFSEPSVSSKFLDDLENALAQYLGSDQTEMAKKAKSFRSLAIRIYCLAGYMDESVKMLQTTRSRGINVTAFTYDLLLQKLTNTAHIEIVQRFQNVSVSISASGRKHATKAIKEFTSSKRYDTNSVFAETRSVTVLARDLLLLRKSIISPSPPTALSLARFFHAYRSIGRSRGLVMLNRKAFGSSHVTKSLWLRAEMLFYLHTNQFPLLISTFARHFYLIGVPTAEVLPVVNMQMRQTKHNRRAFMKTLIPWVATWERIWPTNMHTALVWQALVSMTRSTEAIQRMYYQLVQMTRSSSAQVEGYSGNTAPPVLVVTQGHFAPFLVFYARRATGKTNVEHVTRIFNDMLQLGISPSEHTLNILVAAYARSGDNRRVESVLKRMETNMNVCEDIPEQRQFPPPSIVTYTSIIQGFVESRSLQSALAMETRMMQRIQFVEGMNKRTDSVLVSLRRLQREIGNQSGDKSGSAGALVRAC
jgi:hypothetical protein